MKSLQVGVTTILIVWTKKKKLKLSWKIPSQIFNNVTNG